MPPPLSTHSSHFTLTTTIFTTVYLLLTTVTTAVNITHLLSPYPDLSDFSTLLTTTSVATDLSHRSSVTLLAVPNSFLRSSPILHHPSPPTTIADILRYHVLLQYIPPTDLTHFPPSGKLFTTLFQTTGRATSNFGYVNITNNEFSTSDHSTTVRSTGYSSYSGDVISVIKTIPYNITILSISNLIVPYGFDVLTSETPRPPLVVNISKALLDGHNFNVVEAMLSASGVVEEFENDERGAGITLFVPTDDAFADMGVTAGFQSLSAEKKGDVLRFHVLHSYYPLGSLQSIVNPVQPTLATEDKGAGSFTLNISRVNGSVAISTGIVQASVTQTVFDQNPIAIFGISRVLLPKEIFGKNAIVENTPTVNDAPSPVTLDLPLELYGPSLPPRSREESHSSAMVWSVSFAVLYIGLLYVVV